MSFKPGLCPHCHCKVDLPEENEWAFCPECGTSIRPQDAFDLLQQHPEYEMAPESATTANLSAQQPSAPQPPVAPGSRQNTNQPAQKPKSVMDDYFGDDAPWQKTLDTPFLRQWKTDALFTILGIAIRAALMWTIMNVFPATTSISTTTIFVYGSVDLALGIMGYVMVPRRFTPDYHATNFMVSFWNGFVGGIIFGCWWNYRLTTKRLGLSHVVFFAIALADVCSMAMLLFTL